MSKIPFSFILDELVQLDPIVKPMFGCHAIYTGPKLVLIVRKKGKDDDDGVWVSIVPDHIESMKKLFPSMRPVEVLGPKASWLNIPAEADDFESSVMKVCELVLLGDERIGKIPKGKKKKKK